MASKPKIEYLDLFRAVGILAVLAIHVTGDPMVTVQKDSGAYWFYYTLNTVSQFAVPSFLFLSGLVLFYNYGADRRESGWVWSFYRKRLKFIIVPYLIWSLFYFLFVRIARDQPIATEWDDFLKHLIDGKNYTHLYFVIVIAQFYLLFPIFVALFRSAWIRRNLIWLAALAQIAFKYVDMYVFTFNKRASLFLTYILVYGVGAYIGLHFEQAVSALRRWTAAIGAVWAVAAVYQVLAGKIYYVWFVELQPYRPHVNFAVYSIFTVFSCLLMLALAALAYERCAASGWVRALTAIGVASFGIYLVHPAVLLVWRNIVVANSGAWYNYASLLGFVAALGLSWLAFRMVKPFKWNWMIMGK